MRAIVPATPTRYRSSGPGCSISASLLATITSIRSRLSASFTSCTERSWPTASGVIELGKATVSFSGSTGSVSGSVASAGRLVDRLLEALDDLDRHDSTVPSSSRAEIGTWRLLLSAGDRQLHPQDPVLVGGAGLVGDHVGAELDLAPEGALLDLELLVDAALGVVRLALAGDHEHAPADLEIDVVERDAGEVDPDHRLGRVTAVVDVDAGAEGAPVRRKPRAGPDVAEQLVDLAPHALEVGEGISRWRHLITVSTLYRQAGRASRQG